MIEVIAPGPLTTVQDGGRAGLAALGVPRSGAFDRAALRLANRLVGNPPEAPALEITFGGVELLVHDAATVALAGAPCPGLDQAVPVTLPAGSRMRLGVPAHGLRSYLAVRGGVAADPVLGSASTDTLSGLGPAPLRAGDRLPIGPEPAGQVSSVAGGIARGGGVLRVVAGPRDDWFEPGALDVLTAATWTVRADSNRIGVRLDGPRLERARTDELPSEATLPGAVQVPPDGRPIVLGPDAPVTGGYPVIAVVRDADFDLAAQLRPGDRLRFRIERDWRPPVRR
jgi:biotin-dependent carboxylase-like uncharacterized protein